jgi:hypothetical protein
MYSIANFSRLVMYINSIIYLINAVTFPIETLRDTFAQAQGLLYQYSKWVSLKTEFIIDPVEKKLDTLKLEKILHSV